jgi:hypothetical protein
MIICAAAASQTIDFFNLFPLIFINTQVVIPLSQDQIFTVALPRLKRGHSGSRGINEVGGGHVLPAHKCPSNRLSPLGDGAE